MGTRSRKVESLENRGVAVDDDSMQCTWSFGGPHPHPGG